MHFINRTLLSTIARLMLAMVLFTQYAVATQACALMEPHPAMAFASAATAECSMHHHAMHASNRNACLAHCTAADQTLDFHHVSLNPALALLPLPGRIVPSAPESPSVKPVILLLLSDTGGSPLYLLRQNFRI